MIILLQSNSSKYHEFCIRELSHSPSLLSTYIVDLLLIQSLPLCNTVEENRISPTKLTTADNNSSVSDTKKV